MILSYLNIESSFNIDIFINL